MEQTANLYTEERPWGSFTILDEGEGYKVKKLVFKPGKRLSLQYHNHRKEFWSVVEGTALVTCGDVIKEFTKGETAIIPQGAVHRLENRTNSQVTIIEVQNGDYLGEDDIIRLEDDFNRA
jgi:mannose-6-phosphate isomerase